MSRASDDEKERVKEALERLHKVTTPLVTDVLAFAERSVSQVMSALQRAHASVPEITQAAVDVGAAQAELLASTLSRNSDSTTNPGTNSKA